MQKLIQSKFKNYIYVKCKILNDFKCRIFYFILFFKKERKKKAHTVNTLLILDFGSLLVALA